MNRILSVSMTIFLLWLCATLPPAASAGDLNELAGTAWDVQWSADGQKHTNTLTLDDAVTAYKPLPLLPSVDSVVITDKNGNSGRCVSGDVYESYYEFYCTVIDKNTTDSVYYVFDLSGSSLSGEYTEDGWDTFVTLSGSAASGGDDDDDDPVTGSYVYYVPYSPSDTDFSMGFGVSNVGNDSTTSVTVEYFNNAGTKLGQDSASIPAQAHASFMRGAAMAESGWARITATTPVYGMALVFGLGEDPLFDLDFKSATSQDLVIAHVDTSGSWMSTAMLANPGSSQAQVTVTFHPGSGGTTQSESLTIPALGAVQYDLDTFSGMPGTATISSTQGIVGFLLYDGRAIGNNWLGGLSIVPRQ